MKENVNKAILSRPTKMGGDYDREFKNEIPIVETDMLLTEKEISLKKKIFSLAKMESLVHSDPKLSGVYDDMTINGEEKYGYHYNETIMNIIFNDYVLNSSKYLQKYKNAIPKKKKRRDKSGINQLKAKGEMEMIKKGLKSSKNNDKQKKEKPLKENENDIIDVIFYVEDDGEVLAYFPYENHDYGGKFKVCYSHMGQHSSCQPNYIKDLQLATPEQYNDLKNELENYVGYNLNIITHIDETTTTGSVGGSGMGSGGYLTPHAWGGGDLMKGKKSKIIKKPIWNGGSFISEENYLIDAKIFESYYNKLENLNIETMKENRKRDNFSRYARDIEKGIIDPEEYDDEINQSKYDKYRKQNKKKIEKKEMEQELELDEAHPYVTIQQKNFCVAAFKIISKRLSVDVYTKLLNYMNNTDMTTLYEKTEDVLRSIGVDPLSVDYKEITNKVNENMIPKNTLKEHHLKYLDDKKRYIINALPILAKKIGDSVYYDLINYISNEYIEMLFFDTQSLLDNLGIDNKDVRATIDEISMVDDNPDSMANKVQGASMEMGMGGGMTENEDFLKTIDEEIKAFNIHQKKLKSLMEDRKSSSMINKERLGSQNQKNFKNDLNYSGTKKIIDIQKELQWKDQQEEVGDNPKKYSEKIEKDVLSKTKGESFKNVGDSTNLKGNEIPKRNQTKDEKEEVNTYREGMHSLDYDTSNDRFEKRAKLDMGDELYRLGREQVKNKKNRAMYNKDSQPITAEKLNESIINGYFHDSLGKRKIIGFKPKDVNLKESISGLYILDFSGMGNSQGYMGEINESISNYLDKYSFYTDGERVFKNKKTLNESIDSKSTNSFDKMKHLINYIPNTYTNTSNIKRNRGF